VPEHTRECLASRSISARTKEPNSRPAERHHQNYLALHPYQPYIVFNDMPKLERLREKFPALYQ
jgi:hypothetical protein